MIGTFLSLASAKLCPDCNSLHADLRCPKCGSRGSEYISRWLDREEKQLGCVQLSMVAGKLHVEIGRAEVGVRA